MAAPYQAKDIAAWFLANIDRDAGDSITHLKLQKLIYYAQAWSLALREVSLFDEDLRAWAHGPVAETVFQEFKGHGWDAIPCPKEVPTIAPEDEQHLADILASYGELSAKQLEAMTHSEEPWKLARGELSPEERSNRPISKDSMISFYRDLWEKSQNGEEEAVSEDCN
jgi:uncharacterized phage-associated protein